MAVPLYDQLLTQAGGRTSGSPVARPMGGGGRAMQPSIPSYPSPPSVTAGATGRPSSRPAVPGVVGTPSAPAAPASSPAGPTASGTPRYRTQPQTPVPSTPITGPGPEVEAPPQTPRIRPDAPPSPPPDPMKERMRVGGGAGSGALNGVSGTVAQPTLNLNRAPSRRDYVGMLPGTGIGTPYGVATIGADGNPIIQFSSPEHEARYRNDESQYKGRFGPTPLSRFPGAPQPTIQLGRPAFNPFTGTWLTPDAQ